MLLLGNNTQKNCTLRREELLHCDEIDKLALLWVQSRDIRLSLHPLPWHQNAVISPLEQPSDVTLSLDYREKAKIKPQKANTAAGMKKLEEDLSGIYLLKSQDAKLKTLFEGRKTEPKHT